MSNPKKQILLQQIAAIPAMERGKLTQYTFKERAGASGPYHKLQSWQQGKNQTRYVPMEEVPSVKAALAGFQQYQQLTAEYADLVVAETRAELAGSKKKPMRQGLSSPRRRKSKG